ncbi:MAG: 6-carboxytetrahydropterin synthase [Pseudonocardiaceae bacterium]
MVTAQEHPNPPGRFIISKDFEFSASHELRLLPETHKCRGNHGHNYVVTLTLAADRLDEFGFVTDFGDLAPFGDYLKSTLDHRLINDHSIQPVNCWPTTWGSGSSTTSSRASTVAWRRSESQRRGCLRRCGNGPMRRDRDSASPRSGRGPRDRR